MAWDLLYSAIMFDCCCGCLLLGKVVVHEMTIRNDRPFCNTCDKELVQVSEDDMSTATAYPHAHSKWEVADEHICWQCADRAMRDTCAGCVTRECDSDNECPYMQPFAENTYFAPRMRIASFTVYAEFFDAIIAGTKDNEIRPDTEHWRKRLLGDTPPLQQAVFISGQRVYRCDVVAVRVGPPMLVLGRALTPDELDVVGGGNVIVTVLGDEVERR